MKTQLSYNPLQNKSSRWFEFNFENHHHHCSGNMKIHYILLALEHLLLIYSLKLVTLNKIYQRFKL
jgi:hypothetical protein